MKSLFKKNGGTYTKVGDYYLPNMETPNDNYKIGRYGRATVSKGIQEKRIYSLDD